MSLDALYPLSSCAVQSSKSYEPKMWTVESILCYYMFLKVSCLWTYVHHMLTSLVCFKWVVLAFTNQVHFSEVWISLSVIKINRSMKTSEVPHSGPLAESWFNINCWLFLRLCLSHAASMASDLAGSSTSWSSLVFNLNLITMGPLWVTSEIWVRSTSMEALTRIWPRACDYMCMCARKDRIARSSVRMCACRSPRGAGTSLCACGFWPELALKIWPASERRLLGLRQSSKQTEYKYLSPSRARCEEVTEESFTYGNLMELMSTNSFSRR